MLRSPVTLSVWSAVVCSEFSGSSLVPGEPRWHRRRRATNSTQQTRLTATACDTRSQTVALSAHAGMPG